MAAQDLAIALSDIAKIDVLMGNRGGRFQNPLGRLKPIIWSQQQKAFPGPGHEHPPELLEQIIPELMR